MRKEEIPFVNHSHRAARAAQLLSDELLIEAKDAIEQAIAIRWGTSKTTEEREAAYYELKGFRAIFAKLESFVNSGKLAVDRASKAVK